MAALKFCCLVLACLLLDAACAVWQYFYVYSCIHPNPRTPVNITHSGWQTYEVMMWIFGIFVAAVNLFTCGYGIYLIESDSTDDEPSATPRALFECFIVIPVGIALLIGSIFGHLIALPTAQKNQWNRGCSGYSIQVILGARSYDSPSNQSTTAQYFSGDNALYTYDLLQPTMESWSFSVRTIDSPSLLQNSSDPLYPSISNVTYNFVDNTFSANCTSPATNTSTPCVKGSFNPSDYLSFNLIDLRSNVTTTLSAVDKEWTFTDDAPSVLLLDGSRTRVIRTDVTEWGHCTNLKVCVAQENGANIIIPMGLILIEQATYALDCDGGGGADDVGGEIPEDDG